MDVEAIVSELQKAKGPKRQIDGMIGLMLGWTRRPTKVKDEATGDLKRRSLWIVPTGDEPGTVPYYTSSLDEARSLALHLLPDHTAACSWQDNGGSAVLDGGKAETAANVAIALCIATLKEWSRRDAEIRQNDGA